MPSRRPVPSSDFPSRVFVDTGGWIALFSSRDQHHAEAEQHFRTAVDHRIALFTSNLVLAEVHRLLLYRAGARAAFIALRRVLQSESVQLQCSTMAHHQSALTWLEQLPGQPLTYTDAVSFAIMQAAGCSTVIGFDRHFELAGMRLWGAP